MMKRLYSFVRAYRPDRLLACEISRTLYGAENRFGSSRPARVLGVHPPVYHSAPVELTSTLSDQTSLMPSANFMARLKANLKMRAEETYRQDVCEYNSPTTSCTTSIPWTSRYDFAQDTELRAWMEEHE